MQPTGNHPPAGPPKVSRRRALLMGGAALAVAGGIFAMRWFNIGAGVSGTALTAPQALAAVEAGQIVLIDIRRPDEWQRTGIPRGAVPIDMRRPDFIETLLASTGGDRDRAVALICARGVRSSRLAARMTEAGFTNVIDVPEGMLGSGAGPGWLARGMPVVKG